MPEVIERRRILVLERERNRRHDEADAVAVHRVRLEDAVVVDDAEPLAGLLSPDAADGPLQRLLDTDAGESVFADHVRHLRHLGDVAVPLRLQDVANAVFGLREDHVDDDRPRLEEPLNPVAGLDEIGKLEPDAEKDCPVAVALQVATTAEHDGFRSEMLNLAVHEVGDDLLSFVQVLRTPDALDARQRLRDRVAFLFEIVPDDEVVVGRCVDDLHHLRDSHVEAIPLLRCSS